MRSIELGKKRSVRDVKLGASFPTNLIVYNLVLRVDDTGKKKTIVEFSLEKNSRSIGFQDDLKEFISQSEQFEYIVLDAGTDATFLEKWYDKFSLFDCELVIVYSKIKEPLNYQGKIVLQEGKIRFVRSHK